MDRTEPACDGLDGVRRIFGATSNMSLMHCANVYGNFSIIREEDIGSVDHHLSAFYRGAHSRALLSGSNTIYAPNEFSCVVSKLCVSSTSVKRLIADVGRYAALRNNERGEQREEEEEEEEERSNLSEKNFPGLVKVDAMKLFLNGDVCATTTDASMDEFFLSREPVAGDNEQDADSLFFASDEEKHIYARNQLKTIFSACCAGISERLDDRILPACSLCAAVPTHFGWLQDAPGALTWARRMLAWVCDCYGTFSSTRKMFHGQCGLDAQPLANKDMWRNLASVIELRTLRIEEWIKATEEKAFSGARTRGMERAIVSSVWDFVITLYIDTVNRQLWALLPVCCGRTGVAFIRKELSLLRNSAPAYACSAQDFEYIFRLSSPSLLDRLASLCVSSRSAFSALSRDFVSMSNLFVVHGFFALVASSSSTLLVHQEGRGAEARDAVLQRFSPLDGQGIAMLSSMIKSASRCILLLRHCSEMIEDMCTIQISPEVDPHLLGYETTTQCAAKAVLVEFLLRWVNTQTFGAGADLLKHARNTLFLTVGATQANAIVDAVERWIFPAEEEQRVASTIALAWATWTCCVAVPSSWVPQHMLHECFMPAPSHASSSQEASGPSVSHAWCASPVYEHRLKLLGQPACMMLTSLMAYTLLPGRPLPGASASLEFSPLGIVGVGTNPLQQMHRDASIAPSMLARPILNGHVGGPGGHLAFLATRRNLIAEFQSAAHDEQEGHGQEEADDYYEAIQETRVPIHPSVSSYYRTRHFQRVGLHASVAWDDCVWLLAMQEYEKVEAIDEQQRSKETQHPTDLSSVRPQPTAFLDYEREIMLLKPFLLYGAVFASSIVRANIMYNDDANGDFLRAKAKKTPSLATQDARDKTDSPSPLLRQQQQPVSGFGRCVRRRT